MTARLEAAGLALAGRLAPVDLGLDAGSLTMLVGPNGAGKTSLLHALAGIGAAGGAVRIDGEQLSGRAGLARARLLSFLSASRDVSWPLAAADFVALGWPESGSRVRAEKALESVDATEFANRRIDRLSTGERARVMLARSLVAESRVLLLDEPIANLDPRWRIAVIERLRAEADRGAAIVMSVHDLEVPLRDADRVIAMREGAVVADGPPAEALSPEVVAAVFGVARTDDRWVRA